MTSSDYWKKFLGVEIFKVEYYFKWFLYRFVGIELPKLKSQKQYWADRGKSYMKEFIEENYADREIFFQDLLIDELKHLKFGSLFEAGCGFGWNIKRVKDEFPETRIGGVDFSIPQLTHSKDYLKGYKAETCYGDICRMPLKDNAFDRLREYYKLCVVSPDLLMRDEIEQTKVILEKYPVDAVLTDEVDKWLSTDIF